MMSGAAVASCVRRAAAQLSCRQQLPTALIAIRSFGCSGPALQEHHRQYPNSEWDEDRLDQGIESRDPDQYGRRSTRRFEEDERDNSHRFRSLTDFDLEEKDWSGVEDFDSDVYQPTSSMSPEEAEAFRREHDITIVHNEDECPAPVSTFDQINFPAGVDEFFARSGFTEPMPIQAQGWPIAMSGRDLIAIGQTGSGKTLGFLLPALAHIERAKQRDAHQRDPVVLILAPTRELAQQTNQVFRRLCSRLTGKRPHSACIFGGGQRQKQLLELRKGPEIVVATPGRLLDLMASREIYLDKATYLVLDEADRMLDMGFEPQLKQIMSQIRPDRIMSMWSATWPKEVQYLAKSFLSTAERSKRGQHIHLNIGSTELQANKDITQQFEFVNRPVEKQDMLLDLLDRFTTRDTSDGVSRVLVFVATKRSADYIEQTLRRQRIRAESIHGDKSQSQRDRALRAFKDGYVNVLVATDVAARGLDVDDVTCVVNHDMPNNIEDYIHRIGRTGRRGRSGTAVTFLESYSDTTCRLAQPLIKVLRQAEQEVPQELQDIAAERSSSSSFGRGPQRHQRSHSVGYRQRNYDGGHRSGSYNREFVSRRGNSYDDSYNREFKSRRRNSYDDRGDFKRLNDDNY